MDAIAASKVVVLLFSGAANASAAVLNELEIATNRKKPVVPVRLEALEPTGSAEYYTRRWQWFDAYVDFEDRIVGLASAVEGAIAAARSPSKRARRLKRPAENDRGGDGLIVGREAERASIARLLAQAKTGRGGLLVLAGEPGIGKTRLLQAAASDARAAGFHTAAVTNYEHTRQPLGPWIDVLRELEPFLPDVVPPVPGDRAAYDYLIGQARGADNPPDGRRLLVIVAEALERAAKRAPLFLAIDDAQWCDPESIDLLDLIAPRLSSARILIAVGRRARETDAASQALSRLERYPTVQTLHVEALPEEAIRQILATLTPRDDAFSSATIEEIWRRSDGNPLFAVELAHDASRKDSDLLPASVQLSVTSRLEQLASEDARIMEVAAVIGRTFDLEDLGHVANADRETVLRALRQARDASLVRDAGSGTFAFVHELVRAAVYGNAFSAERRMTHEAVGKLLEGRPDAPAALLAYHWSGAGDNGRAARYDVAAGDQALRLNAFASARDSYLDALRRGEFRGTDAAALEEKLATAYDASGAANEAAEHFLAAARLMREAGDLQRASRLELRFAANAYRAGRARDVEAACERVLAESDDDTVRYGAHAILASFYSSRKDPDTVRRHLDAAAALGVEGEVRDALSLAWTRAFIADEAGDAWLEAARGAVELAETRGTPALHALNLVNFAMLASMRGRSGAETDDALRIAVDIAEANGATYTAAYARCEQARSLRQRGELESAYRAILGAIALHVEAVVVRTFLATIGLFVLSDLGIEGRFPSLHDPALLDAAFATGEPARFAPLAAAHVHAYAMRGDADAAARIIKRTLPLISSFEGTHGALITFAQHGDEEDRAVIAALLPDHGRYPPDEVDRFMIAALLAAHRHDVAAAELAEAALDAARSANAPLFEALALDLAGRSGASAIYKRIGARGYLRPAVRTRGSRTNHKRTAS